MKPASMESSATKPVLDPGLSCRGKSFCWDPWCCAGLALPGNVKLGQGLGLSACSRALGPRFQCTRLWEATAEGAREVLLVSPSFAESRVEARIRNRAPTLHRLSMQALGQGIVLLRFSCGFGQSLLEVVSLRVFEVSFDPEFRNNFRDSFGSGCGQFRSARFGLKLPTWPAETDRPASRN